MLGVIVSFAGLLLISAPVGGSKSSDAPATKLVPVIVSVWLLFKPGIVVGDTLLMLGAGP